MQDRSFFCPNCSGETVHTDVGSHIPTGQGMVRVSFRCSDCEKNQCVVEITKAEFFNLPLPRPLTATYFFCEHCSENCDYSLTQVARGKAMAVVVMHCGGCNSEYRSRYPLAEVPSEILEAELLTRGNIVMA